MTETFALFEKWLEKIMVPFGIHRKLIKSSCRDQPEIDLSETKPSTEKHPYAGVETVAVIDDDGDDDVIVNVEELRTTYDGVETYDSAASRYEHEGCVEGDRIETRREAESRLKRLLTPEAVVQLDRKKLVFPELRNVTEKMCETDDLVLECVQKLLRLVPGECDDDVFDDGMSAAKILIDYTKKSTKRKTCDRTTASGEAEPVNIIDDGVEQPIKKPALEQ